MGNDLDNFLTSNRPKNLNKANIILNDKFYLNFYLNLIKKKNNKKNN